MYIQQLCNILYLQEPYYSLQVHIQGGPDYLIPLEIRVNEVIFDQNFLIVILKNFSYKHVTDQQRVCTFVYPRFRNVCLFRC